MRFFRGNGMSWLYLLAVLSRQLIQGSFRVNKEKLDHGVNKSQQQKYLAVKLKVYLDLK